VKKRHPVGVWLLALVTLGIYGLVWYYKINNELRRYNDAIKVDPAMAVIAVTLGAFILVPPFVSVFKTGERINQAQGFAGLERTSSGGVSLLLFLIGLHPIYMQHEQNKVVETTLPHPTQAMEETPTT